MAVQLSEKRGINIKPPDWLSSYSVKSVDASAVPEPGQTGTDWRLHYPLGLFGPIADRFIISRQDVGESFTDFEVYPGDLYIGDRAYGRLKGLRYVTEEGGDFTAMLENNSFRIPDVHYKELGLSGMLKTLKIGETEDSPIFTDVTKTSAFGMGLCAVRKSGEEAEISVKKALRDCRKKQRKINPETIELHRYIIPVTSLPATVTAEEIPDLYRIGRQIEIAFGRLKSMMGSGHLPKKDEASARAWLHGKIFVALPVQAVIDECRFFSRGYPL